MVFVIKTILILAIVGTIQSVLLKLKQHNQLCFTSDLDSHKTIIVQASIKPSNECQVELVIDSNNEMDIVDGRPFKRKRQHFFNCQNLVPNKFMEKFVQQEVCVISRLSNPVVINLSIKDLISPDFQQLQDEELNLVSSRELFQLRTKMNDINSQIIRMQPLGQTYLQIEDKIYSQYIQQKQTLNFIVKLQISLIVMIGIIWVIVFNAIKNKKV